MKESNVLSCDLSFDSEHRIAVSGSIYYGTRKYMCPFIVENIEALRNHCRVVFDSEGMDDSVDYSSGSTFYIKPSDVPRCSLEALAQAIFRLHTSNVDFDPQNSCAEWWTLILDDGDDVGFHWDRDYGREDLGIHVHPHLGSVTYLSDIGGSTIILGHKGTKWSSESPVGESKSSILISRPLVGKHITFDGLLLHGAPADPFENMTLDDKDESDCSSDCDSDSTDEKSVSGDDSFQAGNNRCRITFLVNIWLNHIPLECIRLPECLVKSLCVLKDDCSKLLTSRDDIVKFNPILDCKSLVLPSHDVSSVSWAFALQEKKYVVDATFPLKSDYLAALTENDMLELVSAENGVTSEVMSATTWRKRQSRSRLFNSNENTLKRSKYE